MLQPLTLPAELQARLAAMYSAPQRHYHAFAHVEALIVVANWLFVDIQLLADLSKRNITAATIGWEMPGDAVSSVMVDNEAGGRLALEHLHQMGHRKIAFIRGPKMLIDSAIAAGTTGRADTPPRTFGPLLQLLPALRDDLSQQTRARLDALVDDEGHAPKVEQDWLVDAIVEVLGGVAASEPVMLVLDDMHRADAATIEVIEKLLPRIATLPVLTLLLRQPTGRRLRHMSHAEAVVMEPLNEDEASALVAAAAPLLADETVSAIVSRAGGNPLYLEILSAAAAAAPDRAHLPESLQTAVIARIDELDETSRLVLREASVFGHAFLEEPLKLTTSATEGFYEALDHLCQVGLLDLSTGSGARGYNFRHSLVQQVLLDGLLRRRRAELHLRAAEALELMRGEGVEIEPEQIAYHFEQAGDANRAATYHLTAAERADRLRAPTEARSHRRTANRLIAMTSLAELYTRGRPTIAARVASAVMQSATALLMLAPIFLLFAQRGPSANNQTLGLPTGIIGINPSSVIIAMALGGLPLLAAGIAFSHLAAPSLM